MKKIIISLLALSLIGCASTYKAQPQNFRLKGANDALNITGTLDKQTGFFKDEFLLNVFFDNNKQIELTLDNNATGEGEGVLYNGKKTSATCYSKRLNPQLIDVYCMIFIDNEKTVTLQF